MAGKQLPPPSSGPDLTALLRTRHANTAEETAPVAPAAVPAPTAPPTATTPEPRRARTKGPTMDRRSWYMPRESADALADAIEELHYATRQPKHAALAAIIAVALKHQDEVEDRLNSH